MRKKTTDRKASKAVKLLNVLTVLMAIILLFFFFRMTSELRRVFTPDPYSSIAYYLQDGYYGDMVSEYYRRNYDMAPFSGAHEEEYRVAQYTNAAFLHQFFQTIGDLKEAERFAEQMESARQASGSLAAVTEDVDSLLESIPLYP